VSEWCDEGKAELVLGVLFIDEVHMLDLQCFSYLNRATEERLAPLVVMATNRAHANVRGTDWRTVHGVPTDLLDRCLIIRTSEYTIDDIADILTVRAREEHVDIEPNAIGILTRIVKTTSLRYGMQLLSVAHTLAARRKPTSNGVQVDATDLKRAHSLFYDQVGP
jgi:RuvB-like protein 2